MSLNPLSNPFRFDDPPVFARCIPVYRLMAGVSVSFAILAPKCQGYYGHWDRGKITLCTKQAGVCQSCDPKQLPKKWSGFLFVGHAATKQPYFLELTTLGRDDLTLALAAEESWVGQVISLNRENRNPKSKVVFTRVGSVNSCEFLPTEESVWPTLQRVWRCES